MAACQPAQKITHPKVDVEALREYTCLGNALYWESRGEGLRGKAAVRDIVRNRAKNSGESFCNVLKKRAQFTWYSKGQPMRPLDNGMRKLLTEVAAVDTMLSSEYLWFYSASAPRWTKKMRCKRIGKHSFCREKV